MAYLGLALASSTGIIVYTITLFGLLNRRTHNPAQGKLIVFFLKVAASSAAMGFVCYHAAGYLEHFFDLRRFLGSLAVLVLVTGAGVILLWIFLKVLGVSEVDAYLKRGLGFLRRDATAEANGVS
jgi:peptidoglycan biosynthesis protein MviN/MurJ (putative lipid II flippase)